MAAMETKLLANPTDPTAWQQALYAFLAEKERRSGSRRTVETYSGMLQYFFGQAAKPPDVVTSGRTARHSAHPRLPTTNVNHVLARQRGAG